MARRIMTDAENERQKQRIRASLHRGRYVFEAYPEVDKIEITYSRSHNSFVGPNPENNKEYTWVVTPRHEEFFLLDCLNSECTSIGFNLWSVINSAIRNHEAEVSGTMRCQGNEAPDHLEQSCDGSLKYTIRISYKKLGLNNGRTAAS